MQSQYISYRIYRQSPLPIPIDTLSKEYNPIENEAILHNL